MSHLEIQPQSSFIRDVKRLVKRHVDIAPLEEVVRLIEENTPESLDNLRRRHDMHLLAGEWDGSHECHVCNAGDWLLIWCVDDGIAYLQRTGTRDELF